jgi:hypothetical protein
MRSRARDLLLAVACLVLCGRGVAAQTVVPVALNGDAANRLDILFLGDGYTSAEMSKFSADVDAAVAGILAQPPFDDYRQYLNIRRIEMASAESGVSHPNLGITRDTAFGAYYNCSGIERLICVDMSKVLSVSQAAVPANQRDLIIVLVNDPEYGGSGGTVTVASLNTSSIELVLHETGHTLGLLADEYGGPPPPACDDTSEPSAVNVTKQTDPTKIKWGAWIDASTRIPTTSATNGVPGLFVGAMYCDSTLYRPVYSSKMRALGQAFWQIDVEQLIRRIYAFVDPIDAVSPPTSSPIALRADGTQIFSVTTPLPVSHALNVGWFLDGHLQSSGADYTVSERGLAAGSHTVQVVVTDPTSDVRGDPQGLLTAQAAWTVTAPGPTFTMTADRTSLTLVRGQAGTVALTVAPSAGVFTADITFSCTGMPDRAQCAFAPAAVSSGSGTTAVVMTLSTTAASAFAPIGVHGAPPVTIALAIALTGLFLLMAGSPAVRRIRILACGVVLAATFIVSSCGGSSSTPGDPGTPVGSYTIVATAASGGNTRTVTVVLTVQ